jgi:hypothetical protein
LAGLNFGEQVTGDMLNVHALFPPPPYDIGYQEILDNLEVSKKFLGAIHHIGAGT